MELEGEIARLLATQTCHSEHATRMAREYLRCAQTKDSEPPAPAHNVRVTAGVGAQLWSRYQGEDC
jgi:hypothetical protein